MDRHSTAQEPTYSTARLVGRLRYRQLALLVALGQHGNLHRAAAAVHLAQPSATKIVRDLEQLFGCPLFERVPRGMCPTELGTEVVSFAQRALGQLDRFSLQLERKRQGFAAQLAIATISGAGTDQVGYALALLSQRRPQISIKLLDAGEEEGAALLLAHKVELAVGGSEVAQRQAISYEQLSKHALCTVVRLDHPVARFSEVRLSSLERYPWILPPAPCRARDIIEEAFAEASLEVPAMIIESTSPLATVQIVRHSDAVSLLPESTVRDYVQAGLVGRLSLTLSNQRLGFGILTRRGESLSAAAVEFIDLVRSSAGAVDPPERTRRKINGDRVADEGLVHASAN